MDAIKLSKRSLGKLRKALEKIALGLGYTPERTDDLVTATSEAAMNAVVHGGGGCAYIHASENRIQVRIVDFGRGIAIDRIPDATLRRGYTTAGTLGHGFWLILKTIDRVYLLTGAAGTKVVLEQDKTEKEPAWIASYRPGGWGLS